MRFKTEKIENGRHRARCSARCNPAVLGDEAELTVEDEGDTPQDAVHKASKRLLKHRTMLRPDERAKAAAVTYASDKGVRDAATKALEEGVKATPQGAAAYYIADKLHKNPAFMRAMRQLWGD